MVALALPPTFARASVNITNTTSGYIEHVTMQSYIYCSSGYTSSFSCEHYLNYGESISYNDYSPDGWCSYTYGTGTVVYIPSPYTISSTTTAAPVSQRTKIGVGEVVTVTLSPTPSSPTTWVIVSPASGGGSLANSSPGQVKFTAPDTAADVTVRATTSEGYNYVRTFHVIPPDGGFCVRYPGTGIYHTITHASAGFKSYFVLTPDDVNFENIEMREGIIPGVASNPGYFLYQNGELHTPVPDDWLAVTPPVAGQGSPVATSDTAQATVDDHTPYIAGTFTWPIPWFYHVKPNGSQHQFTIVNQVKTIDSTGAMTISKGGITVTKGLNEASTAY